MAYPTYTGYTPVYQSPYNQPIYQQPQYNTMQNQQPVQQSFVNDVRIATEDEIKAYIVNPNTRIMFMEKGKQRFYIKSADSIGNSTLEGFDYVPMTNPSTDTKTSELDLSEFVKQGDLNKFVTNDTLESKFNVLSKQMEEIKKQIKIQDILKGDKE